MLYVLIGANQEASIAEVLSSVMESGRRCQSSAWQKPRSLWQTGRTCRAKGQEVGTNTYGKNVSELERRVAAKRLVMAGKGPFSSPELFERRTESEQFPARFAAFE